MSAVPKVPRESVAAETPEKLQFGESVATLYVNAVERLAEVQKKSIDLAAVQYSEVIDFWKKISQEFPGKPGLFLLDLAGNGFERYTDTQKAVIDLVVEQSHAMADLAKERSTKTTEGVTNFVKETMERSVATQKKALDHSAAQTKAVFETAKEQFAFAGSPVKAVADSIQRGVDTVIDTQKELLDMAVSH